MLEMPYLETSRLLIRPFALEDLADAHRLFDIELRDADLHTDKMESLAERAEWLQWAARNPRQLAILYQPPFGDRAVILKSTRELIGSAGFTPCLMPFEQIPAFSQTSHAISSSNDVVLNTFSRSSFEKPLTSNQNTPNIEPARFTSEVGLFYAISPSHRKHGYAHEAALALVDYAFQHLNLKQIVATTGYDNLASITVMKKLGMRIEKNPLPEPPWFQIVGVLENPM